MNTIVPISTDTTAYDRVLASLADHGSKITTTGRDVMAQCPAHDDRSPSLHVTRADDRALIHCFAGCHADDVLAMLGLTRAGLFDEPRQRTPRPVQPRRKSVVMTRVYEPDLHQLVNCNRNGGGCDRCDGSCGTGMWSLVPARRSA